MLTVLSVLILSGCMTSRALADGHHQVQVGHDVSWPNCATHPQFAQTFGIVGVTGGLVFTPNPCLFEETHWFGNFSLYLNTGYAGKARAEKFASSPRLCLASDEACLAYNYGYNAGVYALNYAASQFVHTNTWWLDVETENSWSTYAAYNRAALSGMVDALKQRTLLPVIGFYSYPGQWDTITGGWRNDYPNWVATGGASRHLAVTSCRGQAFSGGPTRLTQYTTQFDNDYLC